MPDEGRHLLAQAARCLADGDLTGAEVHLTAALERARDQRDRPAQIDALRALADLRRRQRRELAADRLDEEAQKLVDAS